MRITVDLDEREIEKIKKSTGIHEISSAAVKALREDLKQLEKQRFLKTVLMVFPA
ncbi:MAG: hypothetical protein O3B01_17840 [Planctomycetota bacterium]|nr:hypothetical protein [Planctomycetota bacterium]MDA1140436.1 hypothetical protein [Planctomycetota bacterium]